MDVSKRGKNFTDLDKNILFGIVQDFQNIIENKKTDATNVMLKNEAWLEVCTKFNANSNSGPRTSKQLQNLYLGMKIKARKNINQDKKELYKTGGGTYITKSDELDKKIVGKLAPQFNPLRNENDSSFLEEEMDMIEEMDDDAVRPLREPSLPGPSAFSTATPSDHVSIGIHNNVQKTSVSTPQIKPYVKTKRMLNVNNIADKFTQRKNLKNNWDEEIFEKKIKILDLEETTKQKVLEKTEVEYQTVKLQQEMVKRQLLKSEVELEMAQIELKIKKNIWKI